MKPEVSFVIPVLNAERDIARCIGSIRSLQSPSEAYELLIMDNGSTDRTHQIMQELDCPFEVIGKVTNDILKFHINGSETISAPIIDLERIWETSLEKQLTA